MVTGERIGLSIQGQEPCVIPFHHPAIYTNIHICINDCQS